MEDRLEHTNTLLCGSWGSSGTGLIGVGEKGGESRMEWLGRELSVDSEGRGSREVGDSFPGGSGSSAPLRLTSVLSPFSPSFRIVSRPVPVSRLGNGDGRMTRRINLLMKLGTDEGLEPASVVVSRRVRVGKGCVLDSCSRLESSSASRSVALLPLSRETVEFVQRV